MTKVHKKVQKKEHAFSRKMSALLGIILRWGCSPGLQTSLVPHCRKTGCTSVEMHDIRAYLALRLPDGQGPANILWGLESDFDP